MEPEKTSIISLFRAHEEATAKINERIKEEQVQGIANVREEGIQNAYSTENNSVKKMFSKISFVIWFVFFVCQNTERSVSVMPFKQP